MSLAVCRTDVRLGGYMNLKLATACAGPVLALAAAFPSITSAAEGGNTQYGLGSSQFYSGGIPPMRGLYGLSVTGYYSADRLNDGNGDRVPLDFSVRARTQTLRLLGVTDQHILGGRVWGQLVIPVVVGLDVDAGPMSDSRGGVGDIVVSGGLTYYKGSHSFVLGIDTALPTGDWDRNRLSNPGQNHVSIQPTFGYGYLNRADPKWEFAASVRYIVNLENSDTNYTSGNELVVDYAVGYHFGPVRAAIVGYYLNQLTDDDGPGVGPDGNRGKGFAIGPSLTYDLSPSTQLSISYQKETMAENKAKGDNIMLHLSAKF
ncbi:hypothetical protein E2979_18130 [Paracoccus yeei]